MLKKALKSELETSNFSYFKFLFLLYITLRLFRYFENRFPYFCITVNNYEECRVIQRYLLVAITHRTSRWIFSVFEINLHRSKIKLITCFNKRLFPTTQTWYIRLFCVDPNLLSPLYSISSVHPREYHIPHDIVVPITIEALRIFFTLKNLKKPIPITYHRRKN